MCMMLMRMTRNSSVSKIIDLRIYRCALDDNIGKRDPGSERKENAVILLTV